MEWAEWFDWLERHCVTLAISAWDWLILTLQYAAHFAGKAWYLFFAWWEAVYWLFINAYYHLYYGYYRWKERIYALFDDLWTRVWKLFTELWFPLKHVIVDWYSRIREYCYEWYDKARQILLLWYERLQQVFEEWWTLIYKWFTDWCAFFIDLFETHREKIIYCLTDGWPHVWWFVYTRFELLFQDFENHIEGWTMFVSDPAQALWDWFVPRATELVSNFLAEQW